MTFNPDHVVKSNLNSNGKIKCQKVWNDYVFNHTCNTLIRLSKLNHTKNIIIEVKNIAIQNIILMTLAIVSFVINGAFALDIKLMLNENLDGVLGGT